MRLSHYLLIVATIGWIAIAMVWSVDRFIIDISFAPIELIYLAAFSASCLIGGLVFAQAGSLAAQAEFGGIRFPNPKVLIETLRHTARQRQARRAEAAKQRAARKQSANLRRW